jgi:hypothetical protein
MSKSSEINELATALAKAQGEFSAVPKSSVNPFFKSKYAPLPEVMAAAVPILSKNGLSISQFIGVDVDGRDILTTYLMHTSGQYISQDMRLHLGKDDTSQALGSSVTYARRYQILAVCGMVQDEDDDGNASTQSSMQSAPKAKPAEQSLSGAMTKAVGNTTGLATENMTKMIWAICHKSLNWDDGQMFDEVDKIVGHRVEKLTDLTYDEAQSVIKNLKLLQGN